MTVLTSPGLGLELSLAAADCVSSVPDTHETKTGPGYDVGQVMHAEIHPTRCDANDGDQRHRPAEDAPYALTVETCNCERERDGDHGGCRGVA